MLDGGDVRRGVVVVGGSEEEAERRGGGGGREMERERLKGKGGKDAWLSWGCG